MRKILLLFVLFACSSKEKIEPPPSPVPVDEKAEWTVYEGILKTEFGAPPRVNFGTGGVGGELLVIKRILEMKKSDAYTNKEKAAGLGYN